MPQGRCDPATFQDFRRTFVTNARRAGLSYFRIMAIIEHYKMIAVFERYNTIDRQDLQAATSQLDTYRDTMDAKPSRDGMRVVENAEMGR